MVQINNWFWKEFSPSLDVLAAIIGIIITILALALPLIQDTISNRLAKYNNNRIHKMFTQEPSYKAMLWNIVLLIICLILTFFFKQKGNNPTTISKIFSFIELLIALVSIFIFYKFIKRCNEYSMNTDDVVLHYCDKQLREMSYDTANHSEQFSFIEMCGKVMEQKLRTGNSSDIERVAMMMEKAVIKIYNSIKIKTKAESKDILSNISIIYYNITYRLWKSCYHESPEIAYKLLNHYESVVRYAIKYKDKDKDSFELLFFLYQRIACSINEEDSKYPFTNSFPWKWYFNIIFDDNVDYYQIYYANQYLIRIMNYIIDNNLLYVYNAFIGHIVDNLYTNTNIYFNILYKNKDISKIKNEIQYCIDIDQLKKILEKIEKLQKQDELNDIKETVIRQFKCNNLQFATIIIGAYCLFKNKIDMVQYMLQYNQPKDSEAVFVNKDIVPDNLQQLIQWYMGSIDYLTPYIFLWPGHHDVKHSFQRFLILLMYWVTYHKKDCSIKFPSDLKKQQYEYLLGALGNIKNEVEKFSISILERLDINNIGTVKEKIKTNINAAQERIKGIEAKIEIEQKLDEHKVEEFKQGIIMGFNESIWKKILSLCEYKNQEPNQELNKGPYTFKLRTHIKKSFLAQGDDGIYIGFTQSFSKEIINQIDYQIERAIQAQSKIDSFDRFLISKYDFTQKILDFGPNDIVIFINIPDVYEILYKDKGFQWDNTGTTCGQTSKGTTVLSYGDSFIRKERFIVLNKNDFSTLSINLDKDKDIQVDALNENEELRNEIIGTDKEAKITDSRRKNVEEKLKREVSIEIEGKFYFKMNPSAKVVYIDNIN